MTRHLATLEPITSGIRNFGQGKPRWRTVATEGHHQAWSLEYLLLPPRSAPTAAPLGLTPKASAQAAAAFLLVAAYRTVCPYHRDGPV